MQLNALNGKVLIIPAIIAVGITGTLVYLPDANDSKVSTLNPPSGQWSIFESVDKFENNKYSCIVYSEINPDVHVFDNAMGSLYTYIDVKPEITRRIEDEARSDKEDCRIQAILKKVSASCQSFYARDRLRYEYIVDGGDVMLEEWNLENIVVFLISKDKVPSSLIEYRVLMDIIRNGRKREEVIYKGTALVPSPRDAWSQTLECNRRELANN